MVAVVVAVAAAVVVERLGHCERVAGPRHRYGPGCGAKRRRRKVVVVAAVAAVVDAAGVVVKGNRAMVVVVVAAVQRDCTSCYCW